MKGILRGAVSIAVFCSTVAFAQTAINLSGSTSDVQFSSIGKGTSSRITVSSLGTCRKSGSVTNPCVGGIGTGALTAGPETWHTKYAKNVVMLAGTSQWSMSPPNDLLFKYVPQNAIPANGKTSAPASSSSASKH